MPSFEDDGSGRTPYTSDEMMTVAASRMLGDGTVCFVGIGLPSAAANLARATHAPNLVLIYESGTIGAKIDRFANLNSTVIGPYEEPHVRLPGAGGAPEIAASCREVVIIIRQSRRTFVEQLDFITSVGHGSGPGSRERLGFIGKGPVRVITDLGLLRPHPETFELELTHLHPGVSVEEVQEATGWRLVVSPDLEISEPPTSDELAVLHRLESTQGSL